jgi:hypothetical protein
MEQDIDENIDENIDSNDSDENIDVNIDENIDENIDSNDSDEIESDEIESLGQNVELDQHRITVDRYYNKYSNRELKDICKNNNLSTTGNKTNLIELLLKNNILN